MTKENGNKENTGYQIEVKKAFERIELGVKSVFESENYKKYLKAMSRMHTYSINNSILIMMQAPSAQFCAGAGKWKNEFGRTIKKGAKSFDTASTAATVSTRFPSFSKVSLAIWEMVTSS